MAYLWTGGSLPARYVEYAACVHLYHCTHEAARALPLDQVIVDLRIWEAEKQIQRARG
jgi:hypothetical protein